MSAQLPRGLACGRNFKVSSGMQAIALRRMGSNKLQSGTRPVLASLGKQVSPEAGGQPKFLP